MLFASSTCSPSCSYHDAPSSSLSYRSLKRSFMTRRRVCRSKYASSFSRVVSSSSSEEEEEGEKGRRTDNNNNNNFPSSSSSSLSTKKWRVNSLRGGNSASTTTSCYYDNNNRNDLEKNASFMRAVVAIPGCI